MTMVAYNMPQSILFTHSSDELYGSDIVLLELGRRLDRARFRPFVVTPIDISYEGRLSQALRREGIAHRAVDMPVLRRRYLSPGTSRSFLRRLRTGPAQVQRLMRRRKGGAGAFQHHRGVGRGPGRAPGRVASSLACARDRHPTRLACAN